MKKLKGPKLPKGISDGFAEEVNGASTEDLRSKIVAAQCEIQKCFQFLKEDPGVKEAKEALKEVVGPTRDAMKGLRAKTKFVLEALEQRGAL